MRIVGGAIAGILAALATIVLIEWAGHLVFPFPSDAGLADPEATGRAIATIPVGAKLVVVFGWFAGAVAGGLLAATIGRTRGLAWFISAIVAAAGIVTILMIPQPVWMQIAAVAAPLLGGFAAIHLASIRGRPDDRPETAV